MACALSWPRSATEARGGSLTERTREGGVDAGRRVRCTGTSPLMNAPGMCEGFYVHRRRRRHRLPSVYPPLSAPPENHCRHPRHSPTFPPTLPSFIPPFSSSPLTDVSSASPLPRTSLPPSLSISLALRRALGTPSRVEPPFRAPSDSAPATQRNQTRAGSRVRRGAVLPRMAEAPAALLGLCPVFASSCVPADVLCTRRLVRTTHPPVRGSSLLCTCTRLLTPLVFTPVISLSHPRRTRNTLILPQIFHPVLSTIFLSPPPPPLAQVHIRRLSHLLLASTRHPRFRLLGLRCLACVHLRRTISCSRYSSLDIVPAAAYSALTTRNVTGIRRRLSPSSWHIRSYKEHETYSALFHQNILHGTIDKSIPSCGRIVPQESLHVTVITIDFALISRYRGFLELSAGVKRSYSVTAVVSSNFFRSATK